MLFLRHQNGRSLLWYGSVKWTAWGPGAQFSDAAGRVYQWRHLLFPWDHLLNDFSLRLQHMDIASITQHLEAALFLLAYRWFMSTRTVFKLCNRNQDTVCKIPEGPVQAVQYYTWHCKLKIHFSFYKGVQRHQIRPKPGYNEVHIASSEHKALKLGS